MNRWKLIPTDGKSREENLNSQPLIHHPIFNNPHVITEGWYPVCPSPEIKKLKAKSFSIGTQRFVLFRGDDSIVHGLDAFCPHMGADLGNGKVIGNRFLSQDLFVHHHVMMIGGIDIQHFATAHNLDIQLNIGSLNGKMEFLIGFSKVKFLLIP